MNALSVVISIVLASVAGPFVTKLHRRPLVWVTLLVMNLIIISIYVIIRDTWHPELQAAED